LGEMTINRGSIFRSDDHLNLGSQREKENFNQLKKVHSTNLSLSKSLKKRWGNSQGGKKSFDLSTRTLTSISLLPSKDRKLGRKGRNYRKERMAITKGVCRKEFGQEKESRRRNV